MQKLIINKQDYQKIVAYCIEKKPNEACGILGGIKDDDAGKVKHVYLMENTKASPEDYLMDPEEQFNVFRQMRENEIELISIFHSHPHSPALPSARDLEMAHYPETIYTIISLKNKKENVRGFLIQDNEYQKVPVIIKS